MAQALPKRKENYSGWYNELVKKASLAENSSVRGCMIIKPYGYAIWEKMQSLLDKKFKDTGHTNAYFPLFIPKSYLSREAEHVAGFAKECAVVTHYRLKNTEDRQEIVVDPEAKLEEELIIRPTSEAVIWNTYKNWIHSYRDLPLLINQWANVVRWEMRTRLFLRTTEFLWQEGHTAHTTKEEAQKEAMQMLAIYADFVENDMGIPVLKGSKTENEKFAGAEVTYCVEALMQDGRALQAGTSHFLGQNFAKAFDVTFTNKSGKLAYVWGTSWGVTTRLIGALIMMHSDDDGLILPPRLAPIQVVVIPIYKSKAELQAIAVQVARIKTALEAQGISVKFDDRDTHRAGWKFAAYELQGVPIRLTIGPKDLQNNTVELARRDTKEKQVVPIEGVEKAIIGLLDAIQKNIYQRALHFRRANTTSVDTYEAFKEVIESRGGFVMAHWDGTTETEEKIKAETKATIRCIPFAVQEENGTCIYTGKPSKKRVVFAKAY